jgi:hypothetical protein
LTIRVNTKVTALKKPGWKRQSISPASFSAQVALGGQKRTGTPQLKISLCFANFID